MALDSVASAPQADSNTAEEVSHNALDVILGASSTAGSAVAGATDSASGSNSASNVATGVFTTVMAVAAAVLDAVVTTAAAKCIYVSERQLFPAIVRRRVPPTVRHRTYYCKKLFWRKLIYLDVTFSSLE
ncbi:hypothetical protein L916_02738 [Phytophthora nicotianae]|uniref:Uncharacterized protein n=1 Tax=Phytophthora nicotianae TaxID=4792 RepID=W2JM95_PHYNI|nr:hypothetical protein L916_02738 [Phytophthora nicotianae]